MSEAGVARHHPAPHGHKVSLTALMFGFSAAPVAWIGQLLVSYILSSYACFPGPVPRTSPLTTWDWLTPALFGLDALAIVVTVAAGLVAWRAFARTRDEADGDSHHLLEVGEGRSRFLALCGLLTAAGFLIIIAFNTLSLVLVPLCAR